MGELLHSEKLLNTLRANSLDWTNGSGPVSGLIPTVAQAWIKPPIRPSLSPPQSNVSGAGHPISPYRQHPPVHRASPQTQSGLGHRSPKPMLAGPDQAQG